MKKLLVILLAITLLTSVFAGCGASETEEVMSWNGSGDSSGTQNKQSLDTTDSENEPARAPMPEAEMYYEDDGGVYTEGRKAIKTAEVQMEVNNFQSAYDAIKSMLGTNGYIEESNIWKTPSYYNGEQIMLTNGSLRLRIKAESFMGFTEGLSGIGTVMSASTNEDDISDMYYDTEARLELLGNEKDRLEEYAVKVEDPEIFFQTQSRITQVIYEMEKLQGTLKKWDSKVEYSTVRITISEKHPAEESAIAAPKGFFGKIWDNMKTGVGFLGDVIIFLAGALPVLIILGVFVVVIIIIIRKVSGKNKPPAKKNPEE